jgi:hypothetical protein
MWDVEISMKIARCFSCQDPVPDILTQAVNEKCIENTRDNTGDWNRKDQVGMNVTKKILHRELYASRPPRILGTLAGHEYAGSPQVGIPLHSYHVSDFVRRRVRKHRMR